MINRHSLGTKIAFSFLLLLLVIAGLGATTMNRLAVMHARDAEVSDSWLPSVAAMGNLLTALEECRVYEARLAIATDKTRAQAIEDLRDKLAAVERLRAAYEPLIAKGTEDTSLIAAFDATWLRHRTAVLEAMAAPLEAGRLFSDAEKSVFLDAAATLHRDLAFNEDSGHRAAAEATSTYEFTRLTILIVLAVALIIALTLCGLVVTTISRPLARLTETTRRLADGDQTAPIEVGQRGDEIGALAKALAVFRDNMAKADRLSREQESERASKEQRVRRLDGLMSGFERQAGALVGQIASAATELEATSQALAGNASRTDEQAGTAAQAADDASASVQTTAAAAEQLSASIGEITRQVANRPRSARMPSRMRAAPMPSFALWPKVRARSVRWSN